MLKTFCQLIFIITCLLCPVLAADQAAKPVAGINGFTVMEGDNILWRQPEFDSGDWPNTAATSSGFIKIPIPSSVAWLRSHQFHWPKALAEHPLAINIISGATFELYFNGQFLGANGHVAEILELETNGISDSQFYIPAELIEAEGNVIAIRYSAHGYGRLSLPLAIALNISNYEDIRYQRLTGYVPALLLVGAVALASIFFWVLFIRRRSDKASAWLALMFIMVVVQLLAESSRALFLPTYIGQLLRIGIVLFAAYGTGLLLNYFVLAFFGLNSLRRITVGIAHLGLLLVIALHYSNFDQLSFYFLMVFMLSALTISSYAWRLGKSSAATLTISLLIFCASFFIGYTEFLDSGFYISMAVLAAVLIVIQANAFGRAEQRITQASLDLNQLELDLLKRQIQPHFIMNTLTALSEWIIISPQTSVDMIEALATEFRILNNYVGRKLVPLSEELNLCRVHLELMSYRHDQQFELICQIANPDFMLPPAVFHTLIENAISHARYDRDTCFIFEQKNNCRGEIQLSLTAPLPKPGRQVKPVANGQGLGLAYVRSRLKESWGEDYRLDYGVDDKGRWLTTIILSTSTTAQATEQ